MSFKVGGGGGRGRGFSDFLINYDILLAKLHTDKTNSIDHLFVQQRRMWEPQMKQHDYYIPIHFAISRNPNENPVISEKPARVPTSGIELAESLPAIITCLRLCVHQRSDLR